MEKSLSISKILNKKINKKSIYERLLTEEGAYASLSVGDLLYDYLRVIYLLSPLFNSGGCILYLP